MIRTAGEAHDVLPVQSGRGLQEYRRPGELAPPDIGCDQGFATVVVAARVARDRRLVALLDIHETRRAAPLRRSIAPVGQVSEVMRHTAPRIYEIRSEQRASMEKRPGSGRRKFGVAIEDVAGQAGHLAGADPKRRL